MRIIYRVKKIRGEYRLMMEFDDIDNVNALVTYPDNFERWNLFFNLPTYGKEFTSVEIESRKVPNYGALYNWWCTQPQKGSVKYGGLYNWFAATDSRNIAPIGYHIPSDIEIESLLTDGSLNGYKYRSTSNDWTNEGDTLATNETGFSARPSGFRDNSGNFTDNTIDFQMLCTYDSGIYTSFGIISYNNYMQLAGNLVSKKNGRSIRCIKDNPYTWTEGDQVTDFDGNKYATVKIGNQVWMAENLAVKHFNDGSEIPNVTDNTEWINLTSAGMCFFNNDESNAFETVSIAPVGCHVPSEDEWQTLIETVGGYEIAGGKLKETGLIHWANPNTGATDEFGFHARGAGHRDNTGFVELRRDIFLWTSTYTDEYGGAYGVILSDSFNSLNYGMPFTIFDLFLGGSIRCIKDNSTWSPGDTITDYDGNIYPTVKIGNQVWMTENLRVEHFNNGTEIPKVTDNTQWTNLIDAGMCYYNNNRQNCYLIPTTITLYGGYDITMKDELFMGNLHLISIVDYGSIKQINERVFYGAVNVNSFAFAVLKMLIGNHIWGNISGKMIALKVPHAQMVINSGAPQASIEELIENNSVTVTER